MSEMIVPPPKIFVSYSQRNSDSKRELDQWLHVNVGLEVLSDELITPNSKSWQEELESLWAESGIFILMISNDYLQSSTVTTAELPQILERVTKGSAYIIPVMLEPCDLSASAIDRYKTLSVSDKSFRDASHRGDIYDAIETRIAELVALLKNRPVRERLDRVRLNPLEVSLDLSECNLGTIPPDLLDFTTLQKLELQNNRISRIENLDHLKDLQYLDLSDNRITEIRNLEELKNLEHLDLERNKLIAIQGLDGNTALKLLGLSTNYIETLEGIPELQNLETIYLGRNRLKEVSELSLLPALKRIILTDNQITSLKSLQPLIEKDIEVHLKYALKLTETGIFVKGNPISDPSVDVIALGKDAILDHFNKVTLHGDKKLEIMKLILVGNSGVGKTNLSQFLRGLPIGEKHISTEVLDIQSWYPDFLKSENNTPMLVNIFDFGGQDYYHDAHRLYYSHDTVYVLLWDAESNRYEEQKEVLDDTTTLIYENYPIQYWLESIQYNLYGKEAVKFDSVSQTSQSPAPENSEPKIADTLGLKTRDLSKSAPVLVLQNKIDKPHGEATLDQTILKIKYPNISHFFNTSLKPPGKRTTVLNDVLDDCIRKLDLAGRTLVSYQHEIVENYLKSNAPFEVLPLADFQEKCQQLVPAGPKLDINDARAIAAVLTNLGIVYYLPHADPAVVGGVVFSQIRILNEEIRKLMNIAKLGTRKGHFNKKEVARLSHIDHLLELLERNRSIVRLDTEEYLVPHFLPVAADDSIGHFIQAFVHCHVRFVYKAYFHKSLLMSLFADFLEIKTGKRDENSQTKGVHYWRNGLILSRKTKDRSQMVFVNFVKTVSECYIEIRTMYPFQRTGLERDIEKRLTELNEGWSYVKEVSVDGARFFPVDTLLQNAEKGIFSFKESGQRFSINDFKDLVNFPKLPKKLFISYSSKNSDFIRRFETHLAVLKAAKHIEPWYDRMIEPGSKWDDAIRSEMEKSDLVIFLISPDFLATPYIMDIEVKKALEMEANGLCEIFPIELQPCSWNETDLNKYQMQLNPAESGKKEYFVGKPDNDESWKTILNQLKSKLKI